MTAAPVDDPFDPVDDPFDLSPVEEVRLDRTPLEVVLFQLRLPRPFTGLQDAIADGSIARRLKHIYPYADTQDILEFVFQPGQQPQQKPTGSKTLVMSDKTQAWTVNIARDSLALVTQDYQNRSDLLERANEVFAAIEDTAPPPSVSRIGIRYINRLSTPDEIDAVVREFADDVQAMQRFAIAHVGQLEHAMNDMLYRWPQTNTALQARWGILPPNQVVDGALKPLESPTWTLDIDAFDEAPREFGRDQVLRDLEMLSERAYRFFRWIFTPAALSHFGISE